MNEHIPYTQSNTVKDTTQNYQDSGNSPLSSPTDHYPKPLAICQKYGVLGTKIRLTVSSFLVPLLQLFVMLSAVNLRRCKDVRFGV